MTRLTALLLLMTGGMAAQDRRGEQAYLPGSFNWTFRRAHGEAAALFNAFDYGHAVLYERLLTVTDSADLARALDREFAFLTTDLLRRPPRFGVVEEAISPRYSRLAWRAHRIFDWAHALHRQLYDIYADRRLTDSARLALGERVTDYYLANRDLALAAVPKGMHLMDAQYYSQVFRRRYSAFNGLIWAYHWLQVGLYEPLIAGTSPDAAVAQFFTMIADPRTMPSAMPMTPAIAPRFTARHPRAAAIFDNLHSLHDVISDILLSPLVPVDRKRTEIDAALDAFQDGSRDVMTFGEWLEMIHHMGGVEAMGGPVTTPP